MPVVRFEDKRIRFPQEMSGADISDVLGAYKAAAEAVGETAMTMGSAAIAEPIAGLTGLVTGDTDAIGGMMERMTYQPRTEAGQKAMQRIAEGMQAGIEAIGAQHLPGYWRDRVVPALQEEAGTIGGSFFGAAGLAAMVGLMEMGGVKGSAARRMAPSNFDQRGIFAGVGAKNADIVALEKAKKLAADGVDRGQIWAETGWFNDVDGNWKFEIDDSQSVFTQPTEAPLAKSEIIKQDIARESKRMAETSDREILMEMELIDFKGTPDEYRKYAIDYVGKELGNINKFDYPLSEVLSHEGLSNAYPSTKNIPVGMSSESQFNRANTAYFEPAKNRIAMVATESPEAKGILSHEVQHSIQESEGFAKGGSVEMFDGPQVQARERFLKKELDDKLDMAKSKAERLVGDPQSELLDRAVEHLGSNDESKFLVEMYEAGSYSAEELATDYLLDIDPTYNSTYREVSELSRRMGRPVDSYKRLAGEAEARNVQTRLNMTPEERRAKAPWETLDVPEKELIVKKD